MSPTEQWAANQKFLDRMIARGDDVILASPVKAAEPGTCFARELEYLRSNGFTLSTDGTRMLPPNRVRRERGDNPIPAPTDLKRSRRLLTLSISDLEVPGGLDDLCDGQVTGRLGPLRVRFVRASRTRLA